MKADSRYVKLNTDWMGSEWLVVMSAEARIAWIQLLCHVKANGIKGRAKAVPTMIFARYAFIGEEAVEQMLRAAQNNGALAIEDGVWVVTNWAKYQGDDTNAERQARFRQTHKDEKSEESNGEANSNESNALRNANNTEEKRGEEKKGKEHPTDVNARAPKKDKWELAPNLNDYLPDELKSDQLRDVWLEFNSHRRDRKVDPYTKTGLGKFSALLVNHKYSREMVPALIDRCMAANWQGIPPEEIERFAKNPLWAKEGGKKPEPVAMPITERQKALVNR